MPNPFIRSNPSAQPQRSSALAFGINTAAVIAKATMLIVIRSDWPAKVLVVYKVKIYTTDDLTLFTRVMNHVLLEITNVDWDHTLREQGIQYKDWGLRPLTSCHNHSLGFFSRRVEHSRLVELTTRLQQNPTQNPSPTQLDPTFAIF